LFPTVADDGVIQATSGETVITRYELRDLLDKLDELDSG
jgi:hypothetical protein